MTIVDYHKTHRDGCIKIFKSNLPLFFDPSELPLLEHWLDGKDKGEMAYQNNLAEHFYTVLENDKVVACGGFYIPQDKKIANMVWGMVDRSFHKKGFGKKFLEYRIQKAKELYPEHSIVLDTSQHTYHFFEKLGFKVVQITHDSYGPGLHRYDMIL